MLFLKKFIATGFKSFAQKTEFIFDSNMSGVVGPNGSGKSNIVDAIKWVLGEKSNKTLRGKTNEDVIFHGSTSHEQAKYAEVTLIFDNSKRVLHYEADEVAVTRKLVRGKGINEYFINGESVRLKDIQNIFLDSGLSKGSLCIISQGTVQWFAESKPEERRKIFEEAAGIGLYAKQKEESNNDLAKTNENLNRVSDILKELTNNLNKLSKQAEKAKIYSEKKKELEKIDLIITVKDLMYYQSKMDQVNNEHEAAKNDLSVFEPNIKSIMESLKFSKDKLENLDKLIESDNNELNLVLQKINKIEIKKASLESNLKSDIESQDINKKIEAYKKLISTNKFEIDNAKENIQRLNEQISEFNSMINSLKTRKSQIEDLINKNTIKQTEIKMQVRFITKQLENFSNLDNGVKTILDNKKALIGIEGLVSDFYETEETYRKAIEAALGKSASNIIVDDNDNAIDAVNFLKQNKAGKATFLPINTIKPRSIKPEYIEVLKTLNGFIDTADNLIKTQQKYQNIFKFLLGNVIIAQNLESATKLSHFTYSLYCVITLDGDLINAGGSITGGFNKQNAFSSQISKKTREELENEYNQISEELSKLRKDFDTVNADLNEFNIKTNEKKMIISKHEQVLELNENQLIKYESEYEALKKANNISDEQQKNTEIDIQQELAQLIKQKDRISEHLNTNKQTKLIYKSEVEDKENKLTELRFQVDKARDVVQKSENNKIRCETIINNAIEKLNFQYKMTPEFAIENYNQELPMTDQEARNIIIQLTNEIEKIGPINMNALNELEEIQKRHDELAKQKQELEEAKKDILDTIISLDKKAIEDFDGTIKKVNESLPEVFKYLFGGGSCEIQYSNPDDILSSGIEVIANPLGKKVSNLNLLSGGEKTLVALSILFSILKIKHFPLIILDESESALDPANVERFANIIHQSSNQTQFLVITHRPGTMERCDALYGATMQNKGVTSIFKISMNEAKKEFASDEK